MAKSYLFNVITSKQRRPLVVSVGLHCALFLMMASNINLMGDQRPSSLIIEGALVDLDSLNKPQPLEDKLLDELEAKANREKEIDQREAERKRAEQRQEAEKRARLDAEKREQERLAAEKREQERLAAEKREQERLAAEQREKERLAAELRRKQLQREAELSAALAAEEEQFAAVNAGDQARWTALVGQKVERYWVKPVSAPDNLKCEVSVSILPSGDVVNVRTNECNGDDTSRRSIENAVQRASPLPLPDNSAVFDRNLRFIFNPQQ
ncbi:MAG: cell envelope integrity protein TolA [Pseudomonadota bacterium]|nr:cell envelope integrity protein TolA [Pseudomonadota bacterium]